MIYNLQILIRIFDYIRDNFFEILVEVTLGKRLGQCPHAREQVQIRRQLPSGVAGVMLRAEGRQHQVTLGHGLASKLQSEIVDLVAVVGGHCALEPSRRPCNFRRANTGTWIIGQYIPLRFR